MSLAGFDAVLSIGSQSFLDGLLRLLGPQLDALRGVIPVEIPGLTNSVLSLRKIEPRLRHTSGVAPDAPKILVLRLSFEITGDLLAAVSVGAGAITIALPNGAISIPNAVGKVTNPAQNVPLAIPSLTGPITGLVQAATLTTNAATATLGVPQTDSVLSLDPLSGTIQIPATPAIPIPLPAVVPLGLNLTDALHNPHQFRVDVELLVSIVEDVSSATGHGVVFNLVPQKVGALDLPSDFIETTTDRVESLVTGLVGSVVPSALLPSLPQPDKALLQGLVTRVATALPTVVSAALSTAFRDLAGRTGRILSPASSAPASSACDVVLAARHAKPRLIIANDGGLALQVGFSRTSIASDAEFPDFKPTGTLDVALQVSNELVVALLGCLLEKLPNIAMHGDMTTETTGNETRFSWRVTINLGLVALAGRLSIILVEDANGTKSINLGVDLEDNLDVPGIADHAVTIKLSFWVPVSLGIDSVTSLNLFGLGEPRDLNVSVDLGWALKGALAGIGIGVGLLPGLSGAVALIAVFLPALTEYLLRNAADLVFGTLKGLASPVTIPPGIFEAFGALVPVSVEIDDLVVRGTLATPSGPWAILPLNIAGLGPLGPLGPAGPRGRGFEFREDPAYRRALDLLRRVAKEERLARPLRTMIADLGSGSFEALALHSTTAAATADILEAEGTIDAETHREALAVFRLFAEPTSA